MKPTPELTLPPALYVHALVEREADQVQWLLNDRLVLCHDGRGLLGCCCC